MLAKRNYILYLTFLLALQLVGQVNYNDLIKEYKDGSVIIDRTVHVSFALNEETKTYQAKLKFNIEELVIGNDKRHRNVSIFFNSFQDAKFKSARFYRVDSSGEKSTIERIKVKYADEKDFYVSGIFYQGLKVKNFMSSVELPENYIIKYSYEETINDLKFLNSLYLQESDESIVNSQIQISKHEKVDVQIFEYNLNGEVKIEENENQINYSLKNKKKSKRISISAPYVYYLPHIILSIKSTELDGYKTHVIGSVKDMYFWYNSLIEDLKTDHPTIRALASKITQGCSEDSCKIERIFKWVQQNIMYIAFEDGIAGFKPEEAQNVANLRYGDCKGMANLLVQLLKAEGLDARHAWIGTRNRNYSYSKPSLIVDNHMICAMKFKENYYFLDATSKSISWNEVPSHLEAKEVLIANESSFLLDTISTSDLNSNRLNFDIKVDLKNEIPDVSITVDLEGRFVNQLENRIMYSPQSEMEFQTLRIIKKYLTGFQITSSEYKSEQKQFVLKGKLLNFYINSTGKTIFPLVNLLPYPSLDKSQPPIYIDFCSTIHCDIKLINGQFKSSSIQNLNIENDNFLFKIDAGTDVISQTLKIKKLVYSTAEFENWNEIISQMNHNLNKSVIYE